MAVDFFLTSPRIGAPREQEEAAWPFSDLALEISQVHFCCVQSSHETTQILGVGVSTLPLGEKSVI